MGGSRGGDSGSGPRPLSHGKSQVAIGFIRNTGTGPLKKKLDPMGPILFRGRSIRHSVK